MFFFYHDFISANESDFDPHHLNSKYFTRYLDHVFSCIIHVI